MSEFVHELNEQNFQQEVDDFGGVTVVDFWAPWCGPCRAIAPIIEEMAREHAGKIKVAKVNIDDNPALAQRFQVSSIPRVLYFSGGQLRETIIGSAPKKKFTDTLTRVTG